MVTPGFVGMMAGFSYHQRAGFGRKYDDPDVLARMMRDANHVVTHEDETGLLHHTSRGEVLTLGPSAGEGFARPQNSPHTIRNASKQSGFGADQRKKQRFATTDLAYIGTEESEYFDDPLQVRPSNSARLMTLLMWGLVDICHLIARNRGYTSYGQYFLVGLVAPPVLGLLLRAIFLPVSIKAAALKEDILVKDRRILVGKNHARRRYSRVVPQ